MGVGGPERRLVVATVAVTGSRITTSHDDDETIRRLRATHPCGFLGKPLRSRDLHGAVEVALAARGFAPGTRM